MRGIVVTTDRRRWELTLFREFDSDVLTATKAERTVHCSKD